MIKTIGDLKEQISMLYSTIHQFIYMYNDHIIGQQIRSQLEDTVINITVDELNLNIYDEELDKLDWDKEEDLLIINEKYTEDYLYMKNKLQELGLI